MLDCDAGRQDTDGDASRARATWSLCAYVHLCAQSPNQVHMPTHDGCEQLGGAGPCYFAGADTHFMYTSAFQSGHITRERYV